MITLGFRGGAEITRSGGNRGEVDEEKETELVKERPPEKTTASGGAGSHGAPDVLIPCFYMSLNIILNRFVE